MSEHEDWIDRRVIQAQKGSSFVTDAVGVRIKALLKGQISERQLPPKELSKIAKALLTDIATPTTPKEEASNEN